MARWRPTRRGVLRAGALTAAAGLAGCTELTGGGDAEVSDSDGDGVVDSHDYAPRDPAVQRDEQVELVDSRTDDATGRTDVTESPPSQRTTDGSGGFEDTFADGLDGWSTGHRINSQSTPGSASWSGEHGGSVELHVSGAPSSVQVWKRVGALPAGTTITVEYAPPRFEYTAATIALRRVDPDGNRTRLDADRDGEAAGYEQDGTLSARLETPLSADDEIEIHLSVWPGETTVWVQRVAAR